MFYDRFVLLCKTKNVKPSVAATEIGFNKSNVTRWKTDGYTPRGEVLNKIADYFDVSTDYLLGKEKTATVTDDSLSAEFMALYSRLDENHQQAVVALIESLLDNQ